MASNAQAQPPVQQQQQQPAAVHSPVTPAPQGPTQPPKPTRVSLSYEEISKLFSLPIAEAASILGVCTSVLKRICRTHGIVRWPYRKFVSGKAGDDTNKIDREKAKELLELSKMTKHKASTMSSGAFQGVAKSQHGSTKAGQISPPGKQNASVGSAQSNQIKDIPTYMDDFKYGFPSSGLSSETMKWWGANSHTESAPAKDENQEAPESTNEATKGMTDDELDWGADDAEAETDSTDTSDPSARLCSLRRKAAGDGRRLLNGSARTGQELRRLNKRQKIVLAQVFGASLPEQWRSKLA